MGWKDVLRPIRDGLRDNLPSKQPHDNPEKKKRRQQDLSKGFTYFDSFQDIDDWHPDQAFSFQRANTPLLPRSPSSIAKRKTNVTLIHDFSGNYHDYENVHGSFVDQPSYSGEYMQSLDTFVYFSHKLACVPPPSWTNTLHRNGVKSLGTFLVEPQSTGISRILRRSLSDTHTWEYTLATQLTRIAHFYGFDGWLINIEKTFPIADWSLGRLEGLLKQLSLSFDAGCVIWYDSLTCKNTINYQNALTEQNVLLAKAAGSMLTNYVWTAESAARSKAFALQNGFDPASIIFGIDVWAQSSEGPGRLRETYPKNIGGGTGTGLGVAKLAEIGLSAGIFAPAWPYEHFPSQSDPKAVERSMWTGNALPETLCCSCTSRNRHSVQGYMTDPILKNAQEFPAGSETFFYTGFEQAFATSICPNDMAEKTRAVASLISQSILPRPVLYADAQKALFSQVAANPPRLSLYTHLFPGVTITSRTLSLFQLSMPATRAFCITIMYRKPKTPVRLRVSLQLEGLDIEIRMTSEGCEQATMTRNIQGDEAGKGRITGLSLRVERFFGVADVSTLLLAEIMQVCIRSRSDKTGGYTISDVALNEIDDTFTRLSWKFKTEGTGDVTRSPGEDGLPYSDLTGPFSFFIIETNGRETGRAYSLDYLLQGIGDEIEVKIAGVGYDGEVKCTSTSSLRKPQRRSEESWQLVQRSAKSFYG